MINNLLELFQEVCWTTEDLAEFLMGEKKTDVLLKRGIDQAVYKGTSCGAWITYQDCSTSYICKGVTVGSIIEGCDDGTNVYSLEYPFDIWEFWDKLKLVDDEAEEIWNKIKTRSR